VLYPAGAGSEALVCLTTLPFQSSDAVWDAWAFVRAALLVVWPPALYVMYSYMIVQRRKVLGSGATKKKSA